MKIIEFHVQRKWIAAENQFKLLVELTGRDVTKGGGRCGGNVRRTRRIFGEISVGLGGFFTKNVVVVGIFGKRQTCLSEFRSSPSDYRSVVKYTLSLVKMTSLFTGKGS